MEIILYTVAILLIGILAGAALPFGESPTSLASIVSVIISIITGAFVGIWTSYTFNLYSTLRTYKDKILKDCFNFSELIGWEKEQDNTQINVLNIHLHNRLHEIKLYADEASSFYSKQGEGLQGMKDKLEEVAEALKIAEDSTVHSDETYDSLNECIKILSSKSSGLPVGYIFFILPITKFLKALTCTKNKL